MARIAIYTESAGLVWAVLKQVGDTVEVDEPVLLMELMKMEIPVLSEYAGTVVEVLVGGEDSVVEGQPVMWIETD